LGTSATLRYSAAKAKISVTQRKQVKIRNISVQIRNIMGFNFE